MEQGDMRRHLIAFGRKMGAAQAIRPGEIGGAQQRGDNDRISQNRLPATRWRTFARPGQAI